MIEEHGEKPKTLIGIKNILKVLLRKITLEREMNETLFGEEASGMESVYNGIVEMDMLAEMIGEFFERDSELTNEEIGRIRLRSLLIIEVIFVCFGIIFGELARMWINYRQIHKEIYSILPLHLLQKYPIFSP